MKIFILALAALIQTPAHAEIVDLRDPAKVECKITQNSLCTSAGRWDEWCFEVKYDSQAIFQEAIKWSGSNVNAQRAKLSCDNIIDEAIASNGHIILNSEARANSNNLLYVSNIQTTADLLNKLLMLEESTDLRLKALEGRVFGN